MASLPSRDYFEPDKPLVRQVRGEVLRHVKAARPRLRAMSKHPFDHVAHHAYAMARDAVFDLERCVDMLTIYEKTTPGVEVQANVRRYIIAVLDKMYHRVSGAEDVCSGVYACMDPMPKRVRRV